MMCRGAHVQMCRGAGAEVQQRFSRGTEVVQMCAAKVVLRYRGAEQRW